MLLGEEPNVPDSPLGEAGDESGCGLAPHQTHDRREPGPPQIGDRTALGGVWGFPPWHGPTGPIWTEPSVENFD